MRTLGYIELKEYLQALNSSVGSIISGWVALLSSDGKLWLKTASNEPDRLISENLQFVSSALLTKLRDTTNWTDNVYNKADIVLGTDVLKGQKLYLDIPLNSENKYHIHVSATGVIFRVPITTQNKFTGSITGGSGTISQATHKLPAARDYNIQVQEITPTSNIIHEINHAVDTDGNISWWATPNLPTCTITVRL